MGLGFKPRSSDPRARASIVINLSVVDRVRVRVGVGISSGRLPEGKGKDTR